MAFDPEIETEEDGIRAGALRIAKYRHQAEQISRDQRPLPRSERQHMTTLPPELLQAFADTHYIVHHEAPFVMHIGQPCPDLKALMAEHNALSAAFITAWNPFSQNLPAKENQARHGLDPVTQYRRYV